MESRVKFLGHPVHPMLIVFPLGLLATSVIFDIIASLRGVPSLFMASYWMIATGVIGGLVAAIFGLIDWLAIPRGTRAKSIGMWHGITNVVVTVLFAVSWLLRMGMPANPPLTPRALSVLAVVLALIAAWLGGELVDRLGVGVDAGAHLDSSSSLSDQSAKESDPKFRRVAHDHSSALPRSINKKPSHEDRRIDSQL
jgi:uncharacterized membrane protein